MRDPYGDDEYYDDEWQDDDEEPECTYFAQELVKAPNGHLVIAEVSAWRYPSGWSDDEDWQTEYIRLGEITAKHKLPALIEAGKRLKPGESMSLDDVFPDDDEDDEDDFENSTIVPYVPPGQVDDIPF